ncbi:unnamed protein product [Closterium sp. Naga37s-1]|nr:unnamed protein product [Closterium sp. Naga37s-1]
MRYDNHVTLASAGAGDASAASEPMEMEDCSHHRQLLLARAAAAAAVPASTTTATTDSASADGATGSAGIAARMLPFATAPLESVYAVAREELGRGEFGVVRTCMQRATGQLLACKSVDKARLREGERAGDLEMELLCMGALPPHPHVVQLASVHEDARDVHLVMVAITRGPMAPPSGLFHFNAIEEESAGPQMSAAAPTHRKYSTPSLAYGLVIRLLISS